WISDTANFGEQTAEPRSELCAFEILDEIGEDERAASVVEEIELGHVAAGDPQRCDFRIPGIAAVTVERMGSEIDPPTVLLLHAWGQVDLRVGKGPLPIGHPPIVKPVGRDDPAWLSELQYVGFKPGQDGCRRVDEQTTIRKADDRHSGRELHLEQWQAKADCRAIDNPHILGGGFERVEWWIGDRQCENSS